MSADLQLLVDQPSGVALLCERLATLGVSFAAISPGSRSAPLALALAEAGRIDCLPVIDERSAGFIALGAAKALRRPTLVVTTSGTAAANLAPAVHEAREARVPLIAITADRPPELRGVGEGQTIDQDHLFGTAAAFLEHDLGGTGNDWVALAERAFDLATGVRPGPVQVNLALRPPLEEVASVPPPSGPRLPPQPDLPGQDSLDQLASLLRAASRPLVIAGRDESGDGPALTGQCERLGLPLLADPLSGAPTGSTSVQAWDPIIRVEEWSSDHLPDLVLRTGDMPTSKALRAWLATAREAGARVFQFDPELSLRDPVFATTHRCEQRAPALLSELERGKTEPGWLDGWLEASAAARLALEPLIGSSATALTEPAIAALLAEAHDPGANLLVSASMPIRDIESFVQPAADGPRILSNRGANGIDGVIATGLGIARSTGAATTVLIGDVAFAHDQGSLMLLRDTQPPVTIVLVDNGAGTIFDVLPVASSGTAAFEPFFATPTRLPAEALCLAWGIGYSEIDSLDQLRELVSTGSNGPRLLHARVPRAAGHSTRRDAWSAVRSALSGQS